MGDVRYAEPYERFRDAGDRIEVLRALSDREVIAALAAASRERDPLLANVLATEAQNRAARWQRVMGAMGDALIVVAWPERRILSFNRAAEEMLGWNAEEILGSTTEILFFDHEEFVRFGEAVGSSLDAHAPLRGERELRRRDGSTVYAEFSITPSAGPGGEVNTVVSLWRDITARRASEKALRESEERYRQVAAHSGIGMAIVSTDGRFLEVNDAFCRIVEFSAGELLRKTFVDITHPDDVERDVAQARRLAAGEIQVYTMEKRYVRKDGRPVWIQLTGTAVRAQDGTLLYFIAQVEDIDERKRMQGRLDAQYAVARALADAETTGDALTGALRACCDALGWPVGEYWRIHRTAEGRATLRRDEAVCAAGERFDRFRAEGTGLEFRRGVGLPGRAWARDGLALMEEVSKDPAFARAASAAEAGLRAGLAFPVHVSGEAHGVFAFFASELADADEHVRGVLEDVARQVGLHLERQAASEWARLLLENAPDATLVVDDRGLIASVNGEGERQFGYRRDELVGLPIEVLVPEPAREIHHRVRRDFTRRPERRTMAASSDLVARRKDGTVFPAEVSLSPVATDGTVRVVASVRDVTSRRAMVERSERMRRMFTTLAAANQAILRAQDVDTVYREVCRLAVEEGGFLMAWIGLKAEGSSAVVPVASAGRVDGYLEDLQIPIDEPAHEGPTAQALRTRGTAIVNDIATDPRMEPWRASAMARGYASSGAFPIITDEGAVGTLNVYAALPGYFREEETRLLEDLASDIALAIETLRQREAIYRMNSELAEHVAERTTQLRDANAELEAFTYRVSHDLRAPLRGLSYFLEVLGEETRAAASADARDALRAADREARRMRQIVDDLLAFSRSTTGELVRERVDLGAIAREALGAIARREPGREVATTIQEGLEVQGDAGMMRVVMENLIGNAWKYTSKTPHPSIEVGARTLATGETAYFVRDNGAGFPAEKASQLFTAFKRLHDASEFDGVGLGLATVARIVARHGGRVWAEGRPSEGATFSFTLAPPRPPQSSEVTSLR